MMLLGLTPPIKALILDMDGVLWRGNQALIDFPETFRKIRELGLDFVLVTNNSTLSRETFLDKFSRYGISLAPHQVVNSALATAYLLKKRFPEGGPVYVVGEKGLISSLEEQGFTLSEENVIAVVAGIDRQLTYQKIATAMHLIRGGALFIGTNPDRTYPMPGRLIPGAGTVLAAIEAATDTKPLIVGKPALTMLEMAMENLGVLPAQTLVVGDRLDTDIAGGQAAGCRTALVLSGVTTLEQARSWSPPPDIICENLAALF
ncbi:MAG: HAD-IIA family hydrolase [Anaerolineae bacterium]|nr:HAD-IIA family hydrolase [Anaerolineae bacterium]